MIDCAAFEAMLDRWLAGELPAEEELDAELHAARCARCSELLLLVRGEAEVDPAYGEGAIDGPDGGSGRLDAAAGEDLAAGILRQTSGSPCSRAESLLCDIVDGTLPAADAELLELHLTNCAGCAELAAALVALRDDLPAMAEIEPDPWFVRDVLDATTRRQPAWVAEPALAAARSIESWGRRLISRPRLALELAYSGAMVIFLLWGTPLSPLRGTAEKALSVMRADPAGGIVGAVRNGSVLAGRTSSAAQGIWDHVGSPAARDLQEFWLDVRREGKSGLDAISIAQRTAGGIWGAICRGDLVEAGRVLVETRGDFEKRKAKSDRTPAEAAP